MSVPLLQPPEQHWECPNCDTTAVTHRRDVHTEFHNCRSHKMGGLWAPMVPAGTKAKTVAVEREDYTNGDIGLRKDGQGRTVMATVVTRDDGEDRAVYAPTATGSFRDT